LCFCYLHFWLVFQSHMCSPCGSPSRSPARTVCWVWLSSVHLLCCHSCTVYIRILFLSCMPSSGPLACICIISFPCFALLVVSVLDFMPPMCSLYLI
jgi:hypothetical protein